MDSVNNWINALTPPEESGWYLVYINPEVSDPQSTWRFAVVCFNKGWLVSYTAVVTHWMPLPKPPVQKEFKPYAY
jgi:hypothetical protein